MDISTPDPGRPESTAWKWAAVAAVALRVRNAVDAAAATLAVAVLMGMPGFRDNLEMPLLFTLISMPITVLVYLLLERDHRWWHGLLFVALACVAVGFKEQGLVIVPIL